MTGKFDSVLIRVPYRNLRQDPAAAEVELVAVEDDEPRFRIGLDSPSSDGFSNPPPPQKKASLVNLVLSCTVAASVQFGWALQLSLLTPYIQGKQVLEDSSIANEAQGVGKEIIKQFYAHVSSNDLEIRFYWAGKEQPQSHINK